jgi:hypothetical protein
MPGVFAIYTAQELDDLVEPVRASDPESMQRVQEMIRKERACCAFLTFEIREQADEVWLTIKAPEAARTTADALFEPFLPRNPEE